MSTFIVSESAHLYIPAATAWETVGGFTDIAHWHPGVRRCTHTRSGTQIVRRLDLSADTPLVERLESHDPARRRYTYTILEGPLPVRAAQGILRVAGESRRSATVIWELRAAPHSVTREEAIHATRAYFRQGLEALRFSLAA